MLCRRHSQAKDHVAKDWSKLVVEIIILNNSIMENLMVVFIFDLMFIIFSDIILSYNEHLTFEILDNHVAGDYKCSADNGVDHELHKIITVKVNGEFILLLRIMMMM